MYQKRRRGRYRYHASVAQVPFLHLDALSLSRRPSPTCCLRIIPQLQPPVPFPASWNLATNSSTDLFDFPLDSFDDGYVADNALYNDTVVISLQSDSSPDTGYLATFNLSDNSVVSGLKTTPCFGLWPDLDAPGSALLCLALVGATDKRCPAGTSGQCSLLLRIDRASGAETLLGGFLPDYAPFTVECLDTALGLIYSTFELLSGGTPELVTINARTGAIEHTAPFAVSLAFIELEYSRARGKVYAVVQDGDVAYAGTVDPTTAVPTPLSPASAYFNRTYWNQFNTISTLSDELGVFFTTAFHYAIPSPPSDPILHLIGNSLTNGALVYDAIVSNPFCEILWLPTSIATVNGSPLR